jgi:hypothetical protein
MIRTALLAATLAALLSAAATAAPAEEPQSVLAKYLAWRGGPQFQALQSLHASGKSRVGEIDGSFELWLVRDGRLRRNRSLGPVLETEVITRDGAWKSNASGQIEDLADGGQADRRAVALAFADVGKPDAGMSYRLLGTERREERTWAVVRVGFGGSDTYDLFLDPTSGELLGARITEDRATRFVRFGQWKSVAGVRMPFEARVTGASAAAEEYAQIDALELNVAPASAVFARPASTQTWSFAAGRRSTGWVDFEFFNDSQIFIPATVNGRAVNLILDSGADITVVDKTLATSMGLKLSAAAPVTGTGGESTMQLVPDLEVRIGELGLHHVTAGVIDLSVMAGQLGHALPLILGKEVFNQLIVDIDFPHRRIAFNEPANFSVPAGAVRVPLGRHGDNRSVPVSVEGGTSVAFDFDLGSNSPLIVYPAYRDGAHLLDGRRQSVGLSAGVGGLIKPRCATLRYITLAGTRLANVPADFPEPADGTLNSDRTAGNIGLPVFSRFRLITDYAHDELWLVADAKALAEPFLKNRAGLLSLPAGDRLKVLMVAPGSPAERAGWKEGTEIVAVNGQKIGAAYRTSVLSHWATQAAGTRVALTLVDGSTRELILADYF